MRGLQRQRLGLVVPRASPRRGQMGRLQGLPGHRPHRPDRREAAASAPGSASRGLGARRTRTSGPAFAPPGAAGFQVPVRTRPGGMRTYVRALEQPDHRRRRAAPAARVPRPGVGTPLRRARGDRDALLRGAGEVGAQQGSRGLAHAVPVDRQPLQGMQSCVCLLLRPPDPHLPRLRRRPRLRARDRRQGERAGGAARRARAAVVEPRTRRARARTPTPTSGSRAATA